MDLSIVRWVAENVHNPLLDWLMPLISALGNFGLIWLLIGALLLIYPKTRRWGIIYALTLFLMVVAGEVILKNIVQRPRPFTHLPELALLIPPPSSYSFPSVHTATAFAGASALFLMNRRLGCLAGILAVLIAFSRLYLSVHYLTDLLGGAVLGILCALAAKYLYERCTRKPLH